MAIFGRKKREGDKEGDEKIRDLKPENKNKRKEALRPWGKKERYTILAFLLVTVLVSGILSAASRNWKLPGLPRLTLPNLKNFSLGFLEGETITVGKKVNQTDQIDQEKKEKIIAAFKEKTKTASGIYALYIVDLTSGDAFGVNENEAMQAASLIKLPVMLYAAQANNAQGRVDEAKIEAMGKRSDNNVFNELIEKFGEETLQKYIAGLGMTKTSLAENETTAKEIGDLLAKIYLSAQAGEDKNEKILDYLTDTIYEDWLKKGIPEVRVAHKYGREVHVVNDAGVVFSEKPFVLVIMSQGVVDKEADSVIPEIAALVFETLK